MVHMNHKLTKNPAGKSAGPVKPYNGTLFDQDAPTRETRALAYADSLESGPSRRERIARYVDAQGVQGATRDEIAEALKMPIQSVCSPVKALVASGKLSNTKRKRVTRTGAAAVVIVATRFANEVNP